MSSVQIPDSIGRVIFELFVHQLVRMSNEGQTKSRRWKSLVSPWLGSQDNVGEAQHNKSCQYHFSIVLCHLIISPASLTSIQFNCNTASGLVQIGSTVFRNLQTCYMSSVLPCHTVLQCTALLGWKKSFGPLKVLKKLIFGPQKMEKMIFLKNPSSVIWLNTGGGQDSCPGDPDSVRPLDLICST